MKKILIINIFGIGDVLFTTPLIKNIKEFDPIIQIGYVANKRAEDVLVNNPDVDKVFVYERDAFNDCLKQSKVGFLKKWMTFLKEIKKEKYDVVLDFSFNVNFGFMCMLAGIKNRIGFDYKSRGMFLTKKIPFSGFQDKHVVEHYFVFLEMLGIPVKDKNMHLPLKQEDLDWAKAFLSKNSVNPKEMVIGIVPGGGASWGKDAFFKQWPAEEFAKLTDKLIEKYKATIILMGDNSDLKLCESVLKGAKNPLIEAVGKTNISQFAALLTKCQLVIVNDGGPLHIAVSSKVPTVSVFGPVDDKVYGPYPREHHTVVKLALECQPCYHKFRRATCDDARCLKDISVENVLLETEDLIQKLNLKV